MFDPQNDPQAMALLKQRTQAVYDGEQQKIQAAPLDGWSVFNMQANQRNAASPMAPWFQALNEAAGGRKIKMAQGSSFGSDTTGTAVDPYETSYGQSSAPSNQFGTDAPKSYSARHQAAVRGMLRARPSSPGTGHANSPTATEGII